MLFGRAVEDSATRPLPADLSLADLVHQCFNRYRCSPLVEAAGRDAEAVDTNVDVSRPTFSVTVQPRTSIGPLVRLARKPAREDCADTRRSCLGA